MLDSRLRADDGFSLVEILVVILIVGILAAVGLALLLTQRAKAQDAAAKAAVATAAKAMEAYNTEHGSFSGATPAELTRIERALGGVGLSVHSTARTFTVSVGSAAAAGAAYTIERTGDGRLMRGCTLPGIGSCRSHADERGDRW